MKCPSCGREIGVSFYCPSCSFFPVWRPHFGDTGPEGKTPEPGSKASDKNPIASAALVVVGTAWVLTFSGSIVGMSLAIAGIVLGAIGLAKSEGRGYAVAALLGGTLLLLMFRVVATIRLGSP